MEFDLTNPVLKCFAFYAAILVIKTVLMGLWTAFHRNTKKVFATPEDAAPYKDKVNVTSTHPDVERVKRIHMNDIENILPFVLIGFLYVLTGPSVTAAKLHFRIYATTRILHTIVYQLAIPQPSRAIAHLTGVAILISMGFSVVMTTASAL